MRHYDCRNEHLKCETFYDTDTQVELITGITIWWARTSALIKTAIIHHINFYCSEDGCGAEVFWSA